MEITVETLAKVAKILDEVKNVETLINKIDSIAKGAINGQKYTFIIQQKARKKKQKLNGNGTIEFGEFPGLSALKFTGPSDGIYRFGIRGPAIVKDLEGENEKTLLAVDVKDTATLQILGVILAQYNNKREDLIREIKALKIEL